MTADPRSWGKPLSALLGALKMQLALGLPSIGGKDSMSGTFEHISVPPTLIAFGITTVDAGRVISPELKWEGNKLYLIKHTPLPSRMPDTEQLKANWDYVHAQIAAGRIVSAWALGRGGVAEGLAKMSFGNLFGINVNLDERQLFDLGYGSILVEAEGELDFPQAVYLGDVTPGDDGLLRICGERILIDRLLQANAAKYAKVYPAAVPASHTRMLNVKAEGKYEAPSWKGPAVDKPLVYIPVFPGTNCDYDTAKAFRKAGADVAFGVFRNLTGADVLQSIDEMAAAIDGCQILMLAGGFSAGDEPDGSGKFIANVLNNARVAQAIEGLLERGGLILGICNGFQALVKSGLLPYGHLGRVTRESPTLFRNDINRHISQMATTRVASTRSPWLAGMSIGDLHTIAVSHGEGRFVVSEALARELFARGQVAFQYVDPFSEEVTMEAPYNPNGSCYAIEGIISPNGQILGKMGHTERWEPHVFKNIEEELYQPLFDNAVKYFKR